MLLLTVSSWIIVCIFNLNLIFLNFNSTATPRNLFSRILFLNHDFTIWNSLWIYSSNSSLNTILIIQKVTNLLLFDNDSLTLRLFFVNWLLTLTSTILWQWSTSQVSSFEHTILLIYYLVNNNLALTLFSFLSDLRLFVPTRFNFFWWRWTFYDFCDLNHFLLIWWCWSLLLNMKLTGTFVLIIVPTHFIW